MSSISGDTEPLPSTMEAAGDGECCPSLTMGESGSNLNIRRPRRFSGRRKEGDTEVHRRFGVEGEEVHE